MLALPNTLRRLRLSPGRAFARGGCAPDAPGKKLWKDLPSSSAVCCRSMKAFGITRSGIASALGVHWALGFVLVRVICFRWLTPHTSTFSTAACRRALRHLFRKSLQFRPIARTRQVLTPSMPRNLCRNFFDGKFCFANCRASTTFPFSIFPLSTQKYFFASTFFCFFLSAC